MFSPFAIREGLVTLRKKPGVRIYLIDYDHDIPRSLLQLQNFGGKYYTSQEERTADDGQDYDDRVSHGVPSVTAGLYDSTLRRHRH